ncbi:MAG: DUF87 domain-containing protein [Acidilobaceae archaeon]
MVNILDVLIIGLAVISLLLIIRNMMVTRDLKIPIGFKKGSGVKIKMGGATLVGYTLVADSVPSGEYEVYERLVELARSLRVNITFISTIFKVDRGKLLRFLDDEIKKTELAYTATKHIRYAERLKFLQDLYKLAIRDHRPYLGSLAMILWIPEDSEDHIRIVEAFRSIVEAETGIILKSVSSDGSLGSIISFTPQLDTAINTKPVIVSEKHVSDKRGVVIGRYIDGDNVLVLDWPRDFEAHIGVFGPTGKGKTVLLAGLTAQLGLISDSRLDPYMVAVIDPKGDLKSLVSNIASKIIKIGNDTCIRLPRLDGVASELIKSSLQTAWGESRVETCLGSLVERGLVVYDLSELPNEDRNVASSLILSSIVLEASEKGLPGKIVIVIDEAWRIAQGTANHMIIALREGRSKGVYIVYATQSPSDIPQPILDNTRVIIAFGGFTKNYVELARRLGLENGDTLLKLPVGEALVRIGDKPPVNVLVYNYKSMLEKNIIEGERIVSSS